jgi:hypothetical protein
MEIKYAATRKGLIYHLLAAFHRTLCGLYIVGDLYLIEKPGDRMLCKHCERIAEEQPEKK